MQRLADPPLQAVQRRRAPSATPSAARGGAQRLAPRGARQRDGEDDRQRHEMELVGASEQVREPDRDQRRQRDAVAARERPARPQHAARHEDRGQVELEQLVGVQAAVVVQREGQALEVLQRGEAQHLVGHRTAGDDREGRERERRDDRCRERRRARAAGRPRLERRAERGRDADLGTHDDRQAGEGARAERRPARGEQGAEAERQRRRVGPGAAGPRHGARHRSPRAPAPSPCPPAAHVGEGEHGDGRVDRHAHDAPPQQRRAEELDQRGEQQRLARRVVGPEVAVGPLAVGDPARPGQHQALVVRAVAAQDREGRQRGRAEREQRAGRQLAAAHTGRARPRARRGGRRRAARREPSPSSASSTTERRPRRNWAVSKRRALATHAAGSTASASKAEHGLGQRLGLGRVEEDAGLALDHRLAHAALVQGDHGTAGGLGLDCGDAELLGRGDDERPARGQDARRLGVADAAR